MAYLNQVNSGKLLHPSIQSKLQEWITPTIEAEAGQFLFRGTGLHPGAAAGYFIVDPGNLDRIQSALKYAGIDIPLIYATDIGDCENMQMLARARGLLSSNASPNAWCAVQAKSEGIPTVIGIPTRFSSPENPRALRELMIPTDHGEQILVDIWAYTVRIEAGDGATIEIAEGDLLALDGGTGHVFRGHVKLNVPHAHRVYELLTDILQDALQEFGPVQGWSRYRDTARYQQVKSQLAELVASESFMDFQRQLRVARSETPLKIMATAHTLEGTLKARLMLADIDRDNHGDVIITLHNRVTGLGLLRTERYFRETEQLNALRTLILGPDLIPPKAYQRAEHLVFTHETQWLHELFKANSGCQTVVRTLCMPLNKLFPDNLDLQNLAREYEIDIDSAQWRIRDIYQESETFHGCRGARLHSLRHDLATLQIEAVLRAASTVLEEGGEVDLTILVAMVTFPAEITMYMDLFDHVYERMMGAHFRLPDVKLAIMVETSAAYHEIEQFIALKRKHIQVTGALFGGNDFTAATLNLNRHDAVKNMIPQYMELGILRRNPFVTLHEETVGKVICNGLWRMKKAAHGKPLMIGFGGEQAGDWQSVAWLSQHAVPEGLNYVSTSTERMLDALFAAASSGACPGMVKRYA